MDYSVEYKKQLEFYEYLQKQRENYVDLGEPKTNQLNQSVKPEDSEQQIESEQLDPVVQFAHILFNKQKSKLNEDLSGILIDETMEVADVFCMLVELVLHGLDILTNSVNQIFDLKESTDDIIYVIKQYLKSSGFDLEVHEDFMELDQSINLYRDRSDYYCQITARPPEFLCYPGWYVLNYRLIDNPKFDFDDNTPLDKFRAFFISKQKKIFVFNFKFANKTT